MRVAIVFLAGLCALVSATPTPKTGYHHEYKVADKEYLTKQYDVLRLFKHVHQSTYDEKYITYGKDYHMEEHLDYYTKPEAVKEFYYQYKHGMLPKGEIFSVFHEEHLEEAVALFKVFYYAKNWESFVKTAWWAREHVNEGLYVYALSVAIVHRPDAQGLVLPPIYEIYPYYFFPTEVIHEAQKYKQQHQGIYEDTTGYKGYTVFANYSGHYLNLHPQQALGYFTEDIGVNAFYYYYNLYYPFWMDGEDFDIKNPHRGEQFYYVHQQILARYYLERVDNGLGEIPYFDYDSPIDTGFYPSLQYPSGLEFPARPSNVELHRNHDGYQSHAFYNKKYTYSYTLIQDYERRIRDAIDQGFVFTTEGKKINLFTEEGFETLGNLIESNPDSPDSKFYGALQVFARFYLGYSYYPLDKYQVAPSALEHFETSLRDPVFYQFYKRIVMFFQKYKSALPAYKYEDLYFPGVKVEDAKFDELITYFDYFYSDLSNAVYVTEKEYKEDTFHVRARQERLNYKPFTYKLYVNSEKAVDSIVRVFIGPKHDEYDRELNVTYNRLNFVEFDRFTQKLQQGKNVIERNSHDSWYSHDYPSYNELYETVEAALQGKQEFHYYDYDYYYGFPSRFLLPMGSEQGSTYQFYFIVSPYQPEKIQGQNEWYWPVGFESKYVDHYAYGYPFDRPIYDEHKFYVPNSFFYDVDIYHKEEEQINAPHH